MYASSTDAAPLHFQQSLGTMLLDTSPKAGVSSGSAPLRVPCQSICVTRVVVYWVCGYELRILGVSELLLIESVLSCYDHPRLANEEKLGPFKFKRGQTDPDRNQKHEMGLRAGFAVGRLSMLMSTAYHDRSSLVWMCCGTYISHHVYFLYVMYGLRAASG